MKLSLAKLWRKFGFAKVWQLQIMRLINDEFLIGVTGIIFDDKKRVLVLRHTYRKVEWSLPGGYLKAREHPSEGLEREVMEESGFTVSADKQLKMRTDRETGRIDIVYLGKFIGGNFSPSHETTDYKFCAFEELPVMMKDQILLVNEAWKIT